MVFGHLAAQRLSVQTFVAEMPNLLGAYGCIALKSTCHCALIACRVRCFRVSFPKPVARDNFDGEFWDYGEEMQLLTALRSPSFDPVESLTQLEDDVYLVLGASGLHDLWPDYEPPKPLGPDDRGPLEFSKVDFVTNFPHLGTEQDAAEPCHSNQVILEALEARCQLPDPRSVVEIVFTDKLCENRFFPRPLHFAVIHNSATAVRMILSYIKNRGHSSDLRESLQYPFDYNFGELSPLFLAILFADSSVCDILKQAGSKLNPLDYQASCNLHFWGFFGRVCLRMVELGLVADMFVLRQSVLMENRCRISWTDSMWSLRARTHLTPKQFQEPYEERERCQKEYDKRHREEGD